MKAISNLEIIENPQFVGKIYSSVLNRNLSLYEDGSMFCEASGQYYAPEVEDRQAWQMRQEFDQKRAIRPGDRYLAANRERRVSYARYGILA
jgi:hypothetical protein